MGAQLLLHTVDGLQRHPMPFPQFGRAIRAVQHKHRLSLRRDDVDMGRAVIVCVDHHPQAIEAKDSWHCQAFILSAWVFQVSSAADTAGPSLFLGMSHPLANVQKPQESNLFAVPGNVLNHTDAITN